MTTPQRELGMAIAMLVEAFRVKEVTPVMIRIYEKALKSVPVALLVPAAERAITTRTFFPKPAELLADAELVRREIRDAHPYQGCIECEDTKGWRPTEVKGVAGVERCPCEKRWREKLAVLGYVKEPLALPAGREMTQIGAQE